jgi:hypothetical protein
MSSGAIEPLVASLRRALLDATIWTAIWITGAAQGAGSATAHQR